MDTQPIDTPAILDYTEIEEIANALIDFIISNDETLY
jgi:hypothetical protein